ncbi:MAG: hypothetical protein KatS3mg124_1629 [Porticoccaceae bacterium]|nr:MAG: hypothetical protein KatS3mg124_1629 [Porticoccaceae bacterium]
MAHVASQAPPAYETRVVKQFALMAVFWGVVAMAIGVVLAAQLALPSLFPPLEYFHFGRLRPLHTNAAIFAFGGSALMATSYWVVQRTCQTPLFAPRLAAFTFWGWQAHHPGRRLTLPLGDTTSKEYAELEWPIDIAIALVWVASPSSCSAPSAAARSAPLRGHLVLHRPSCDGGHAPRASTAWPGSGHLLASPTPSTPASSDALVQWWYGHNAVGFFLTAASSG